MRPAMMRPLALASVLALSLLSASCSAATPAAPPHRNATAHAVAGSTSHPTPHPTPQPSVAGHTTARPITLTLSKQHYSTEDPLFVTIHNDSQTTIWVLSASGECSSLVAEHLIANSWEPTGQCMPASAISRLVSLKPGETLSQRLTSAQGVDSGSGWLVGTYRVMLQYGLRGTPAAVSGGPTAYSPPFTIG